MRKISLPILIILLVTTAGVHAATPREVVHKIYQQCMAVADKNFAQQQKDYCSCTSEKIAAQVSAQEMASIASQAGQGASQEQLGNAMMKDPRFIQIVSHCFSTALGQQGSSGGVPVAPQLNSTNPAGIAGKTFSSGQ